MNRIKELETKKLALEQCIGAIDCRIEEGSIHCKDTLEEIQKIRDGMRKTIDEYILELQKY